MYLRLNPLKLFLDGRLHRLVIIVTLHVVPAGMDVTDDAFVIKQVFVIPGREGDEHQGAQGNADGFEGSHFHGIRENDFPCFRSLPILPPTAIF